ncbi:uncharacterized protein LOC132620262 [Lycium barbarum]|uniref:uncharacterized protein LOC132620262 n=1 Tax=Lycium barbarum TaxID=112863 RepID=UPI00293E9CAA|nr:uncharacterized protein LOC132620262 [Lycium barbarum]
MTRVCRCGFPAVVRISWSDDNPGKRFWGCQNYKVKGRSSCKFFDWYEPPFLEQANGVIWGLLKKKNKYEQELKWSKTLKICLCISVLCNLMFYLGSGSSTN